MPKFCVLQKTDGFKEELAQRLEVNTKGQITASSAFQEIDGSKEEIAPLTCRQGSLAERMFQH